MKVEGRRRLRYLAELQRVKAWLIRNAVAFSTRQVSAVYVASAISTRLLCRPSLRIFNT